MNFPPRFAWFDMLADRNPPPIDRRPVLVLARVEDFNQWRESRDDRPSLLKEYRQLMGRSSENTQLVRLAGWERSWFLGRSGVIDLLNDLFPDWRSTPIEEIPSPAPRSNPIAVPAECLICADYHGRSYGGNFLVCGIHPQGWHGESTCPDQRSTN